MKKVIGLGKYFFVIFLFSCALFCACIGIYALQKSMTIKMNFNVLPNIRCELYVIPDGGNEKLIFSNYQNLYIDPDWTINEGTSTLSYLHNLESNLGNHYTIKVLNYTPTKVFAEVSGTGASYSSVALDAFSTTPDNLDNVLTISAVSSNYEINFYKVENYFLTANLSGVQFDLTNYEDNTLLKCGNNYYIPLGEDFNGKLTTTYENASIVINSIQYNLATPTTPTHTYTNNILTILNDNITNDITLSASGVYFINPSFTNVSFDTSYELNTVIQVGEILAVPAGTNLQAKLISSTANYHAEISSLTIGSGGNIVSSLNMDYLSNQCVFTVSSSIINANISIIAGLIGDHYTVTFDANGGSVSPTTKTVTYGSTYGTLPTPTGATFKGWNGKNLLPPIEEYTVGYCPGISYNNGMVISDPSRTDGTWWHYAGDVGTGYNIVLQNNTNYLLSFWVKRDIGGATDFYNAHVYLGSNYGSQNFSETEDAFVPTDSWKRFSVTLKGNGGALTSVSIYRAQDGVSGPKWYYKDFMLEESPTATDYEPYYILSTTQVVRTTNHTLRAIWS